MADLPETNQWTPGVYQIETSDPVVGGPEGVTNLPIKQLSNRTVWLKQKIEALISGTESVGKAKQLTYARSAFRYLSDYAVAFASQYEAEEGTDTHKPINALGVHQAIASKTVQATERASGIARIAIQFAVRSGVETNTFVTPHTLAGLFPFRGCKVYSKPGIYTWDVPSGVTKAWVVVIGGGGGGARSMTYPGPSGGSGAGIARKLVDLSGLKSVTITVGAGGIGASHMNTQGGNGGTSSFGIYLNATAGYGGRLDGNAPHGGEGIGGDENECIGFGGHPVGSARNTAFLGGAGGGGESGASWDDARVPISPGHGGGGRGASVAPNGAAGRVTIQW